MSNFIKQFQEFYIAVSAAAGASSASIRADDRGIEIKVTYASADERNIECTSQRFRWEDIETEGSSWLNVILEGVRSAGVAVRSRI